MSAHLLATGVLNSRPQKVAAVATKRRPLFRGSLAFQTDSGGWVPASFATWSTTVADELAQLERGDAKAGGNQMVRLTFYGTIETKANTFAGLPPPTAGNRGFITDCNSATYNAVAAGGGTNKVPVFGDGAAWRVG